MEKEAGKGVAPNDGGSANEAGVKSAEETRDNVEKIDSSGYVEKTGAFTDPDSVRNQMECDVVDAGIAAEKLVNAENAGGEDETVISDDKANCEAEDNGGGDDSEATTSDAEQNVQTDKSLQSSADGEDKSEQEQQPANQTDEDNNKEVVNEENVGSETKDAKHSETTNVYQREENGEAMDIDYDEADRNASNVVEEMVTGDLASDLTGATESAASANPNSITEDAAPSEVEPLDHNPLFDPRSDITSFIDFTGVSSWSGNTHVLKTYTRNVSLKEDKKATDIAEGVATEDCNEALTSVGDTVNVESRDCPKEASDEILGSDENQEDKDQQPLAQKTVGQQDTRSEEDGTNHEAPSIDPNEKEDTVMEENPNNSDCADVGTDSDIKTNRLKRKADVLSEDSLGEGRKTVSLAKVSFKIGACMARAASQMAGSPSVLKSCNETLSVETFLSQLHSAATDPVKENGVSDIAAEFFVDFRNSSASQQHTPEKVGRKRGRPSNSKAETFEFEELGDTYWTDMVIHNGGEEQTPLTEKENYQDELKPAEVKRTRRRYRRRQSQIGIPLPSDSDKPANFDENAPAELVMNFSETDTIPPEKSLSKMFRHFGPIRDSQTEVDKEKNRARVVFRKGADAEVAYKSAGKFNIFGTKTVNYDLSFTIAETFKVQPYVVSLGEEEAMLS